MNPLQSEPEAKPCGMEYLLQKLRRLTIPQIEALLTQIFFALYLDDRAEENIVDSAAFFPVSGYRMARETFEVFGLAPPSRLFCFDAATRMKGKEKWRREAELSSPSPPCHTLHEETQRGTKKELTGSQKHESISAAWEVRPGISHRERFAPAGCVGCALVVLFFSLNHGCRLSVWTSHRSTMSLAAP